ncbi:MULTISPECIES: hypothetical protein [unclassified Haloferax]|nr:MULTISPECIES: hypothetical protein [unclassified Haloferax]
MSGRTRSLDGRAGSDAALASRVGDDVVIAVGRRGSGSAPLLGTGV